jgi:hypothetical protein
MTMNYDDCMTVGELKEFLEQVDDTHEVWFMTGKRRSSPVREVSANENTVFIGGEEIF